MVPWFGERIKFAYRCNRPIIIAAGDYFMDTGRDCCGGEEHITDLEQKSPVPITNYFTTRLGFKLTDMDDEGAILKITYVTRNGNHVTDELTMVFGQSILTSMSVREVVSIKKEPSNGMIRVYSTTPDGNCCDQLFPIYPLESHLNYSMYSVNSQCCNSCDRLVLVIKRKYLKFTEKHYNYPIDFADHGLALIMEAISEKDKRTPEGFAQYNSLLRSGINFLKTNTTKEQSTFGDVSLSKDYPAVVNGC
jgi:hypothetical protein